MDYDIAIIGGGAAGLAAAIFAAQSAPPGARIALLDGAKKLGAKILVSGGGRCNVTNDIVTPADFNGPQTVIRNILRQFTQPQTIDWFQSLGVHLKREPTGKLFPTTDSAQSVLDALLNRCTQLNVSILTNHRVTSITRSTDLIAAGGSQRRSNASWLITHSHGLAVSSQSNGSLTARKLILATGGRSLPKTGSDGSAYSILQSLGHSLTTTYPALVPLILDDKFFHASLSGISFDVQLTTSVSHKRTDQRSGSLLFTHFGLSGPVVMDASRHWIIPHAQGKPVQLHCSFLPDQTFEQADRLFTTAASSRPNQSLLRLLADTIPGVPERLARALINHAQADPAVACNQLSKDARRNLVHTLIALPLPVLRDRGWNYAEVTAGGVPLSQIDFRTMASRIAPDLYLIGELLDVDGRIGGFNFQWAWSTGFTAATAATKSLAD